MVNLPPGTPSPLFSSSPPIPSNAGAAPTADASLSVSGPPAGAAASVTVPPPVAQPPTTTHLPPPDARGVRHAALSSEDKRAPTMAVVKQLVIQAYGGSPPPDLDTNWSKYVTGFSSEAQKTSDGAVVLTTYGRDPKYYQCDVTFKIEVKGPDDQKVTMDFTQTIQTRIKVPLAGDSRAIKEAQINVLFKITAYRQTIQEPLLTQQNLRIQELVKKQTFTIQVERAKGGKPKLFIRQMEWYGRNIYPDKEPTGTAEKTLHVFQRSITHVRVEGREVYLVRGARSESPTSLEDYKTTRTQLPPETIWNTKVVCKEIDERNSTLNKIYEAAANSSTQPLQENQVLRDIISLTHPLPREGQEPRSDKPTGLGLSQMQIQNLIARECKHNLEDVNEILGKRGPVADLTYSPLDAKSTQVSADRVGNHIKTYRNAMRQLPEREKKYKPVQDKLRAKQSELLQALASPSKDQNKIDSLQEEINALTEKLKPLTECQNNAKNAMAALRSLKDEITTKSKQIEQQIETLKCIERNTTPLELDGSGDEVPLPESQRIVQLERLTKQQHNALKETIQSHKDFLKNEKLLGDEKRPGRVKEYIDAIDNAIEELRSEFGDKALGMPPRASSTPPTTPPPVPRPSST